MLEELKNKVEKEIKKLLKKENLSADEIYILNNEIMKIEYKKQQKDNDKKQKQIEKQQKETMKDLMSKMIF